MTPDQRSGVPGAVAVPLPRHRPPASVRVVVAVCYLSTIPTLYFSARLLAIPVELFWGIGADLFQASFGALHGGLAAAVLALALGLIMFVIVTVVMLCLALFGVFGALLAVLVARKLQRGRRWAQVVVLLWAAAGILWNPYNAWRHGSLHDTRDAIWTLGGLALAILMIALLTTPAARCWFRGGSLPSQGAPDG